MSALAWVWVGIGIVWLGHLIQGAKVAAQGKQIEVLMEAKTKVDEQ